MATKFLTLDVGSSRIVLAEYESGKGSLKLVNYGIAPLAAPLDAGNAESILAPALLEIVREKGIKPGPVAVAISGQMVFPRFAAIPVAGGADRFEQMVRYEVEQNIPFPIDEMTCDRQVVGETEAGDKNVFIVAAKTEQIEEITSAVRSVGFMPTMVDVAPIAVTNATRAAGADGGCCVILDIGAKTTSLIIADGERLYNRSIPVAGNVLTREIAQALGVDVETAEQTKRENAYVALGGVVEDEDETRDRISKVCRMVMTRLQAEVSRSVNFYRSQQGGSAPVKLYLTGGTALLPQIDGFFAENLGIETEYLNPFAVIGLGNRLEVDQVEADVAFLAVTAGIAMHQAGSAFFAIDLLPASIIKERSDTAKIPFAATAAVALIAAGVLAMVAVNRQIAVIDAELEMVESRTSSLKGIEGRVKTAIASFDGEVARADELKKLFDRRVRPLAMVNGVRQALGNDMWIEKWEGDRVTIRGWADDLKRLVDRSRGTEGGGKSTASEIVAERLKSCAAVDPTAIEIAEMTSLGRNGEIVQFTMVVKNAKGEAK